MPKLPNNKLESGITAEITDCLNRAEQSGKSKTSAHGRALSTSNQAGVSSITAESSGIQINLPTYKMLGQRHVAINTRKTFREYPEMSRESFKVIKKLGKGTFGKVYLVEDQTQKQFALKMVGTVHELRHECAVQAVLTRSGPHDNLINLIGISKKRSVEKYMLMEVGGPSLHKYLKKRGKFNTRGTMKSDELRNAFYKIVKGVSVIEKAGYQHNDLKPKNILIDKSGNLKICDFAATFLKNVACKGGTPVYMPPEKLGKESTVVADKADSWALGCIFAEMRLGYCIFADVVSDAYPKSPQIGAITKIINKIHSQILQKENKAAADLFKSLIQIDPEKRLTPTDALRHDYFCSKESFE